MQNFVNLKKNKSTGQTSCIIPCKLSCSLHYLYILYLYSVTKKKKRTHISLDKRSSTNFYTEDMPSSLNSILHIYARVK